MSQPCRNMQETGRCRFGDKCTYSHDISLNSTHYLWNRVLLLRNPHHERRPPITMPISPPTTYLLPNSTTKEPCLVKSPSASQHSQHALIKCQANGTLQRPASPTTATTGNCGPTAFGHCIRPCMGKENLAQGIRLVWCRLSEGY